MKILKEEIIAKRNKARSFTINDSLRVAMKIIAQATVERMQENPAAIFVSIFVEIAIHTLVVVVRRADTNKE